MTTIETKTYWELIIFCLVLFLGFGQNINAQNCLIMLEITDSLSGEPLDYANVSFEKPEQTVWTVLSAGRGGRVDIELEQGQEITLNIAFLGYKAQEIPIRCDGEKKHKDLTVEMVPSGFELDEVIITDKFPDIVEKKDTVIYNVSEFLTGNEEKLRDLLNKLPGLHVDRNNVVTYNGEVVRAILVEYDRFFTGDPSLAVKFIPADAVDKVEVLEAHNEFKVLQGLGINDELALNIHLKEDKKQFFFGEGKLGTDGDRKFLGHNNLFYYSPNFNANNIMEWNTTDQPALTRGELIKMVGMELNNFDPKGDRDFMRRINEMQSMLQLSEQYRQSAGTALQQIKYKFKNKASVDVIGLARYAKSRSGSNRSVIFPQSEEVLQTTDISSSYRHRNRFLQFDIRTNPSANAIVNYRFKYRKAPTFVRGNKTTKIATAENAHFEFLDGVSSTLIHEGTWIQKWQDKFRTILIYRLENSRETSSEVYRLKGLLIPDIFGVEDNKAHLWQDDRSDHRAHYGLLRMNYSINKRSNLQIFSRLSRGNSEINGAVYTGDSETTSVPFFKSVDTFGTALTFSEWDVFHGIRYQLKSGRLEVEAGLEHQYIALSRNDREDYTESSGIAPHLDISYNFLGFAEVGLRYNFDYSVPRIFHYRTGLNFNDYNRFSSTSGFLTPEERHSTALSLRRTLSRNAGTVFLTFRNTHIRKPINASYEFSDKAFFTNYFQSEKNRKDWMVSMNISRFRMDRRIVFTLTGNLSEFYNLVDREELPFNQWAVMGRVHYSRTWENIELGTSLNSSLRNIPLNTGREQLTWSGGVDLNFDWFFSEKWALHVEPGFSYLKSNQLHQLTVPLHLGIAYKILNNRLQLRLDGRNLTNEKYRGSANVSPSLTTISNTREFPRYLMFSATYVY